MTYYKISHALLWLAFSAATALLCLSCSINSEGQHRKELMRIDSIILKSPDSALVLLQGMNENAKRWKKDDKMHYDLMTIKATDKARLKLNRDSAIKKIVAYYEAHSDPYLLANAYYYAGRTKVQENDALLALDYFNKAQEQINEDSIIPLNVAIQLQKGYIYRNQGFFLKERNAHRNAYRYSLHSKDTVNMIYSIRDIGGTYESLENYDSCNWYLHAALHLAEKVRNKKMIRNIMMSLADNYKYLNKYDSAKYYLNKNLKDIPPSSQSPVYCNATEIYQHEHIDDSARYYANKLLIVGTTLGKRCAYRNLTRLDLRHHDVEGAKDNFEKFLEYSDSAERLKSEEALANAMSLYDYNEYVTKSQRAQTDRNKALTWLFVTLMALLLAVGIIVYLITFYKRKQKNERMKILLLESISQKYHGEHNLRSVKEAQIVLCLRQLMSDNNNLSDEGWNELEEQFELLHPDFMLKLETLGNFKTTEKRVFLLRKMGFSPIEISKLACLSPQAVTSIRSRAYYKITHQKGSPDQMDELLLKL